jgi:hypothetical protein
MISKTEFYYAGASKATVMLVHEEATRRISLVEKAKTGEAIPN